MSAILDFYRRTGRGAGRTFEQIINFDDFLLETVHDWVQWVFPLPERSKAQPRSCPILASEDIEAFKTDQELRAQVGLAVARFTLFLHRTAEWKDKHDHNHLRITRVLRFLTLIGMQTEARDLCRKLLVAHPGLPPRTVWYWKEALNEHPAWLE
jgi:hypothetical protein